MGTVSILFLTRYLPKSGAGLSASLSKAKRTRRAPLRTDFGLGGADLVTLAEARDKAPEYRRLAKQGLNPRFYGRIMAAMYKTATALAIMTGWTNWFPEKPKGMLWKLAANLYLRE